jgi:integration host factor subunit alpha
MITLTKADLIDSLCSHLGLSKARSTEVIESLLEIVKETLESGEDVLSSGFGKFCVKEKKKRRGRNPQTGEVLMLDARRLVTFRCSSKLRDRINAKGWLLDGR